MHACGEQYKVFSGSHFSVVMALLPFFACYKPKEHESDQ